MLRTITKSPSEVHKHGPSLVVPLVIFLLIIIATTTLKVPLRVSWEHFGLFAGIVDAPVDPAAGPDRVRFQRKRYGTMLSIPINGRYVYVFSLSH